MLTFSLFPFLYSGSFSFPTAAFTLMCDGDQLLVFDWWRMVLQFILWKSISLYILVYFNHLLLQVAICPVANPLDENDSEEQQTWLSNLFFTYWHWVNRPSDQRPRLTGKRESNMDRDDTSSDREMPCLFQWPPHHRVLWVWCMSAWTMSEMAACGSSVCSPCQLTDSFMPLCTETSLSEARWEEGRATIIFAHICHKHFSPPFYSINCALWLFCAKPREHSDRDPHSYMANKC